MANLTARSTSQLLPLIALTCLASAAACGSENSRSSEATRTTSQALGAATITSIKVTPPQRSVPLGGSAQLRASADYSDGSHNVPVTSVAWSSSDAAIVTVSSAGLATAVAPGVATITATASDGVTGSSTLTVVASGHVASVEVTAASGTLQVDLTEQLTATGTLKNGSTVDLTSVVQWASSAPGVATVSDAPATAGLVTSVAPGVATITATDLQTGVASSFQLTVPAPSITPYLAAPIFLPGAGAGIDIYGGPMGNGSEGWNPADPSAFVYDESVDQPGTAVMLDQVDAILGPASWVYQGVFFGVWNVQWQPSTASTPTVAALVDLDPPDAGAPLVTDLLFIAPYAGTLTFHSPDGSVTYTVALGSYMQAQGADGGVSQVTLDWGSAPSDVAAMTATVNALYQGLCATFAPSLLQDSDCTQSDGGQVPCVVGNNFTAGGYLYFPLINFVIYVGDTTTPGLPSNAPIVMDLTNPSAGPPTFTNPPPDAGTD